MHLMCSALHTHRVRRLCQREEWLRVRHRGRRLLNTMVGCAATLVLRFSIGVIWSWSRTQRHCKRACNNALLLVTKPPLVHRVCHWFHIEHSHLSHDARVLVVNVVARNLVELRNTPHALSKRLELLNVRPHLVSHRVRHGWWVFVFGGSPRYSLSYWKHLPAETNTAKVDS